MNGASDDADLNAGAGNINEIALNASSLGQLLASIKTIIRLDDGKLKELAEKYNLSINGKKIDRQYTILERLVTASVPAINVAYQEPYLKRLADSAAIVESKLEELTKQVHQVLPLSLELTTKLDKVVSEQDETKRSWAQVVSNSEKFAANATETKAELRNVLRENRMEEQRKCNVVVFGLFEDQNTADELNTFKSLCVNELDCTVEPVKCRRLGPQLENKQRPLLVVCKNENDKRRILMSAKLLRNAKEESAKRVFIAPDLTREEREMQKKLRAEKIARELSGETNLMIRGNRIIKKNT